MTCCSEIYRVLLHALFIGTVLGTAYFEAAAQPQVAGGARRESTDAAGIRIVLPSDGSTVEFVAVGWPSALRIRGTARGLTGSVSLTDQGVSGSIALDLDKLETGIGLRDRHMKERYLETLEFPRATLTLVHLGVPKLPDTEEFTLEGVPFTATLALHGVVKPVSGVTEIVRKGNELTVDAELEVKTSDFGIETPSYLGITVAENVKVKATFAGPIRPLEKVTRRE